MLEAQCPQLSEHVPASGLFLLNHLRSVLEEDLSYDAPNI